MIRTILLTILLIIYGNLQRFVSEKEYTQGTNISFLDIGIGDSTLVRSHGMTIFIDGGPEDNILYKLRKYLEIGEVIDLVIITHFHNDHYAGIYELLERYDIGEVWMPDVCETGSRLPSLLPVEVKYRLVGGELVALPTSTATTLYAISAHLETGCFSDEDANKSSIVVVISEGKDRALLMGDAYIADEKEFMSNFPDLFRGATILKAGHHCSKTSSSKEFLEYVAPRYVICSTGKDNTYGHPDPQVISMLEELEIRYIVTYQDGDISFKL